MIIIILFLIETKSENKKKKNYDVSFLLSLSRGAIDERRAHEKKEEKIKQN